MKMKSVYCYMLAGLMLSASSCSSWLSEDDAPVMSYDYYETEAGVNAAITAAYGFLRWGVGGERFDVLTELGTDLFTEGEDGSNRESYNKYATQLNPDDGILYEMWENSQLLFLSIFYFLFLNGCIKKIDIIILHMYLLKRT